MQTRPLQPNASLHRLETGNTPSSQRISIGSHLSPEVSQQVIPPFPFRPSQPVYLIQPERHFVVQPPPMVPVLYQQSSGKGVPLP